MLQGIIAGSKYSFQIFQRFIDVSFHCLWGNIESFGNFFIAKLFMAAQVKDLLLPGRQFVYQPFNINPQIFCMQFLFYIISLVVSRKDRHFIESFVEIFL